MSILATLYVLQCLFSSLGQVTFRLRSFAPLRLLVLSFVCCGFNICVTLYVWPPWSCVPFLTFTCLWVVCLCLLAGVYRPSWSFAFLFFGTWSLSLLALDSGSLSAMVFSCRFVGLAFFCVCCGCMACVTCFGLLGHFFLFGRLPAHLVVCLFLSARLFCGCLLCVVISRLDCRAN